MLFSSRQPQSQKKDYALLISFVGQARLQFAGLHSLFLAFWCIVIEIGGATRDLLFWCRCIYILGLFAVADAFLAADVSARP